MPKMVVLLLCAVCAAAQSGPSAKLPADDAVRIKEFYRLSSEIQDAVWPDWSKVAAPLILVTADAEFLTHHPAPPVEFKKVADDVYARPRQFPTNFQATFPVFGPPSVIVIGEPANTQSQSSTPWLFTAMHEHFHQLQNAQPGYFAAVDSLGLSQGDTSGMWMLNYPFPYDKAEVVQSFAELRDLLLRALAENDEAKFSKLANEYAMRRHKFFAQLSADDARYFGFQLWQEGIARYIEVKAPEAARHYVPSPEYMALADYQPFADHADAARGKTLAELKKADLAVWKRTVVYSFGAAEGFLLDRILPKWKDEYFRHMLSLDFYFEGFLLRPPGLASAPRSPRRPHS